MGVTRLCVLIGNVAQIASEIYCKRKRRDAQHPSVVAIEGLEIYDVYSIRFMSPGGPRRGSRKPNAFEKGPNLCADRFVDN
jgi:hypothetical protein